MALISDTLLISGAIAAAFYCWILSRRLKRFNNLENGMGGAIAVLSAQVDDMTKIIERAEASATASATKLEALTIRGEAASKQLEIILASMHDLPSPVTTEHVENEDLSPEEATPLFLRSRDKVGFSEAAE